MKPVTMTVDGNINTKRTVQGSKEIVLKENKTLSYFLLSVNNKDAHVIITITSEIGETKFDITSIETMYNQGMYKIPLKWRPWIQTYDDTNDVYVVLFEPDEPIMFTKFSVVILSESETEYSYELGLIH